MSMLSQVPGSIETYTMYRACGRTPTRFNTWESGTPIHSPNAGRIAVARDLYFSGNTVIIDHGLGLFSMLAHMSAIDVHEGDRVTPGQVLGRVGATGRVTGPHLHWAVRAGGARVDPLSVLSVLGQATAQ